MDAFLTSIINSPVSTVSVLLLALISLFRGWIVPISWFNRLLKAKDEIIAQQAKLIEEDKELKPLVVKLLEKLNEKADSNG